MSPHFSAIPWTTLKKPLEDLYDAAKNGVKRKLRRLTAEAHIKEISKAISHVQKVKALWRIDKEVKLLTFYYPSKVVVEKAPKAINSIAEISPNERFVIQGTVGQGKSIFLRYLCIKELAAAQRLPIFLELRRYEPARPFKAFLISAIEAYRIPCDEEVFDYLAESGKLVLLLDAFDEVEPDAVTRVISELETLAQRFSRLQIVVTSRPDSGIQVSPHFRVYQLAPLTPHDHKPFLDKIVADEQKVKELLNAIQKSRQEITALLQTPLLLTLLVIVYNSTQEIPSSLSEFYDALFQTLLTRHDKTKPGFRRKRATHLSDPELKRLFEAFCYAARKGDQLVLSEAAAADILKRACAATDLKCDSGAFLNDITKVACLMQQEGFNYHFIHKSVAEFHAACFIGHTSEENAKKFYAAVRDVKWQKWRQELEFLSQIDRIRYLQYFYIPAAEAFMAEFSIDNDSDGEIPAEAALKAMNRIITRPLPTIPQQAGSQVRTYSIMGQENFVTNSILIDILHRAIRCIVGVVDFPDPESGKGLGETIVGSAKYSEAISTVQQALDGARSQYKRARLDLTLQAQVGDFVAP